MAYGPFTDKVLEFTGDGLHIVYGPNEAGKSSALRALTALLYGIANNTKDQFVHANRLMRVGGLLCTSDGQKLDIVRRKGNTNTLLSADGTALDEQVLTPYLQGVSKELFGTLFGIDHPALRQGGKDILDQKGEVGQALFSAALGSHVLHDVLEGLDKEASDLFAQRGNSKKINAAIKEYSDLEKEITGISLKSTDWAAQSKALDTASKELKALEEQLRAARSEVSRLSRIQRVLPKLRQHQKLLDDIEAQGEVLVLAGDFGKRRLAARTALDTAAPLVDSLSVKLTGFSTQLEQTAVNQPLLTQAESIQALHARLSSYQQELVESPKLESNRRTLLVDVESRLKQIRPDLDVQDIEKLRHVTARKSAISSLVEQRPLLLQELNNAEKDLRAEQDSQRLAQEKFDKTQKPASTQLLRNHIKAARKEGELGKKISTSRAQLASLKAQCSAELSRLNYWSGELSDVVSLNLPLLEAIADFDDQYAQLAVSFNELDKEAKNNAELMADVRQELDEINRVGQVVTESQLIDERDQRDSLWQLLRRQWVDGDDVTAEIAKVISSGSILHDSFEERVSTADDLADRLRREADRVLKLANLQSRQGNEEDRAKSIEAKLGSISDAKASLDNEWKALWGASQIDPGTPKAMKAWMDTFSSLRDSVENMQHEQATLKALEQLSERYMGLLIQQLGAVGYEGTPVEDLDAMLDVSESEASAVDEALRQHQLLVQSLEDFTVSVSQRQDAQRKANESLEAWAVSWEQLMKDLDLPPELATSEIDELSGNIRVMFENQDKAKDLSIKVEELDTSCKAFADEVAELVANVAPQLVDKPADQAVQSLNTLLSENKSLYEEQLRIQKDLDDAQEKIVLNTAIVESSNQQLDALCREAKCDDNQQLEELEKRSELFRTLQGSISANEADIVSTSDGHSLDDMQSQSQGIDPDALPADIQQLQNTIDEELEPRRGELTEVKVAAKSELAQMDGSDKAAELAETASGLLAGIRSDAERYVRIKLAAKILREHIEQFRQENQGPVIQRASELFSTLTLQSFAELKTDFNDKDEPVLAAIRNIDSTAINVEGMSSGTLDQLYLALRLASLEKYMAAAAPMPFIVDDVLIEFDDARSKAALQALADMAKTTQVILFTHHSRILEQSEQVSGAVYTHAL